jgi:hypothetical protein
VKGDGQNVDLRAQRLDLLRHPYAIHGEAYTVEREEPEL